MPPALQRAIKRRKKLNRKGQKIELIFVFDDHGEACLFVKRLIPQGGARKSADDGIDENKLILAEFVESRSTSLDSCDLLQHIFGAVESGLE